MEGIPCGSTTDQTPLPGHAGVRVGRLLPRPVALALSVGPCAATEMAGHLTIKIQYLCEKRESIFRTGEKNFDCIHSCEEESVLVCTGTTYLDRCKHFPPIIRRHQ